MTQEVPQDVTPPQKRSIRNIPIPDGRKRQPSPRGGGAMLRTASRPVVHDDIVPPVHAERPVVAEKPVHPTPAAMHDDDGGPSFVYERAQTASAPERRRSVFNDEAEATSGGGKRWAFFAIAGLAVVIIAFGILSFFGGAKVTITPKQVTENVSVELTAKNSAISDPQVIGDLAFAPVELTAASSRIVDATGEEEVVEKAQGTITIYNEYTEEEQRLVKNTRFASPDGLIFRIPESVVVPGSSRDAAGNVVPGTLTTTVVADVAGQEYNIAPARFSVPGFEGLPQYDGFYAISKNQMAGGYNGIKKTVSDSDRAAAEQALREEIKQQLITQAQTQSTPEHTTFVDDSLTVYELLDETVSGDSVTINMRGRTNAVVLSVAELAYAVALREVNSFNQTERIAITNLDTLNIRTFAPTGDPNLKTVRVAVEGSVNFTWQLDEQVFTNALVEVPRAELGEVLKQFPGITRAEASIRPFWSNTFPANPEDIAIVYDTEA